MLPRHVADSTRHLTEFRTFVKQAEAQLFVLFKSIDKDNNGKLDMQELQAACKSAGLTVANHRLSEFFNDMDLNHDGYVSFAEWRYVTDEIFFSRTNPGSYSSVVVCRPEVSCAWSVMCQSLGHQSVMQGRH